MSRHNLNSRQFYRATPYTYAIPDRPAYRGAGSLKRYAGQGECFAAAACQLSILLNPFTYAGGIALCLLLFLVANGRALFLAQQAHRALVRQIIVWILVAPGWLLYQWLPGWLAGVFFWPWAALVWFMAIVWSVWRAVRCL